MRFSHVALVLLRAIASAAVVTSTTEPGNVSGAGALEDSIVSGAYIVEFEHEEEDANDFYRVLSTDGIEVEHRIDLRYNLFKGVSFNLQDHSALNETVETIAGHQKVKNIWPVRRLHFPRLTPTSVGNNSTTLAALAKRQQGSDTFSPHVMTQVDKLHAEGITGGGVRIGIVDTGVDYLHPALGGCFGEGCLVAYGYDLNGDDSTSPIPVPDDDPYDDCQGHGRL